MLPGHCHITVYNSRIRSGLTYADYLGIIQSLTMETYLPPCKERLQLIIIKAFFEETVNLTRLYGELGFSVTTKKSDTAKLGPLLSAYGQEIRIARKKGITITGNELRFRMLVIEILLPLIEWEPTAGMTSRRANTPVQSAMADICIRAGLSPERLKTSFPTLWSQIRDYHLSYQSRKLLSLYLCLFTVRQETHPVSAPDRVQLQIPDWSILRDPWENTALLHILSMLDFDPAPDLPVSPTLLSHTARLCGGSANRPVSHSFTRRKLSLRSTATFARYTFRIFTGFR